MNLVPEKLKHAWDRALDLPGIRTLANRDVRFMTLSGYPVGEKLSKCFWRSLHFKAGALASAYVMADPIARQDSAETAALAGAIAAGALIYSYMIKTSDHLISVKTEEFVESASPLVIDKSGDRSEAIPLREAPSGRPSLKDHVKAIAYVSSFAAAAIPGYMSFGLSQASTVFPAEIHAQHPSFDPFLQDFTFFSGAVLTAYFLSTGLRFRHVLKEEWSLVPAAEAPAPNV